MCKTKMAFIKCTTGGILVFAAGISQCPADTSGQAFGVTVSLLDEQPQCKLSVVMPATTLTTLTYDERINSMHVESPGVNQFVEVNTGIDSPESGDPTLIQCSLNTIDFKILPSSPATGPRCLSSTKPNGSGAVFYYGVGIGGVWSENAAGTRKAILSPISLLKDNSPYGSVVKPTTQNNVFKHAGSLYTPTKGPTDVSLVYANDTYLSPSVDTKLGIINPAVGLISCSSASAYGVMTELSDSIPQDSQKIQILVVSLVSKDIYNSTTPGWNKERNLVWDGEVFSASFSVTVLVR